MAVPKNQKTGENQFITLGVANQTVTTSGDLFQFVEIDGKRYSHIIHPKTGLGTTNQIQATVIAPDGTKADALASILTLMNPEDGIALINEIPETEAVILINEEGMVSEWTSNGIQPFLKKS